VAQLIVSALVSVHPWYANGWPGLTQ
jgi:hypothetical protein